MRKVTVAVALFTEHTDDVSDVNATTSPELAAALSVTVALAVKTMPAGCVNEMVCAALPTVRLKLFDDVYGDGVVLSDAVTV